MGGSEPNRTSTLVKLRQTAEVTQKQLAIALGVTEQTVRNWEQGTSVPRLTIPQTKALCRMLRLSLDDMPDCFGPQQESAQTSA